MIDVLNITKNYGPTLCIQGVTFQVKKGDILGFLGPNGAGKSTTMKILTGLTRPTSGVATISGFDVQKQHQDIRKILGYVPENSPLYGDMTLSGFLRFMGGIKGLSSRDSIKEMERVTEELNLKVERKRLLRNLSKGTKQRAVIAQALLGDPQVLILDEPTVGLDPSQINDVRELIKRMRGEKTVILSTHILTEVEMTCNRVVIIAGGKVAAQGTPDELTVPGNSEGIRLSLVCKGSKDSLLRVFKDIPKLIVEHVKERDGKLEAELISEDFQKNDPRPLLCRKLIEAKIDLLELRSRNRRLEDVFLQITQSDRALKEAS